MSEITVLAAAKKIGIFPDLNPDLAGIPGFGKWGIPIWPGFRDSGNGESRFGRDFGIREMGNPGLAGIGAIPPRCRGIGDFGVWPQIKIAASSPRLGARPASAFCVDTLVKTRDDPPELADTQSGSSVRCVHSSYSGSSKSQRLCTMSTQNNKTDSESSTA
jgi:hypothetical protein